MESFHETLKPAESGTARGSFAAMIVVDDELVTRLDTAERQIQADWSLGLRSVEPNPLGIEVRDLGPVYAVMACNADDPFYNRAFGADRDESALAATLDWYAGSAVKPHIETIPHRLTPEIRDQLRTHGLACAGFNSMFVGSIADLGTSWQEHTVASVEQVGLDDFVGTVLDVSGAAFDDIIPGHVEIEARHHLPEWHLYRAQLDGRSCAWARMRVADGTASLCGANTHPRFRGSGLQAALLRRRIEDAAALGCDLAMAQAAPGTTSQRNMERAGLRLAYHKAIWTPPL